MIAGFVTACGTVIAVNHERDFIDTSLTTTAQVISLPHGGHHPEIAFVTNGGEHISVRVGSRYTLDVGDMVQIRYSPDISRSSVQIDTFLDHWMASILLGVFSVLSFIGSLVKSDNQERS